jgi:hypothetical protein
MQRNAGCQFVRGPRELQCGARSLGSRCRCDPHHPAPRSGRCGDVAHLQRSLEQAERRELIPWECDQEAFRDNKLLSGEIKASAWERVYRHACHCEQTAAAVPGPAGPAVQRWSRKRRGRRKQPSELAHFPAHLQRVAGVSLVEQQDRGGDEQQACHRQCRPARPAATDHASGPAQAPARARPADGVLTHGAFGQEAGGVAPYCRTPGATRRRCCNGMNPEGAQ